MYLNWISLDDDRPEEGQTVMVTDGEGVEVVTNGGSIWNVEYVYKECKYAYTHWFPVPQMDSEPAVESDIELKPCPFCGAKNVQIESKMEHTFRTDRSIAYKSVKFGILCPSCFCHGTETYYLDDAVTAWNRREDG